MMLLAPSRAPQALWLAFLPLAAGCVQITDFDEPTESSDGSTTRAGGPASTGAADESSSGGTSTGSDDTPTPRPSGPGASAWMQQTGQYGVYYGVGRTLDDHVLALGQEAVEDLPEPRALGRIHDRARGDELDDLDGVTSRMDGWNLSDVCEQPDGSLVLLAFVESYEPYTFFPLVIDLDPAGTVVGLMTYEGIDPQQVTMISVPRMVCDDDGRTWVVLSYRLPSDVPAVLLARFDDVGFDGWEQLHEGLAGDTHELLGLGRDALGNIHLAIRTGADPAAGEALVRWASYDAEGTVRPELGLDAAALPGTQSIAFAARGSQVVVTAVDPASALTWVVAYDIDGAEQWRTSTLPAPAQGWHPGPVGLADDGSVVMMAAVGEAPDQHLGLVELDGAGVLQWSAEYPFEADGHPLLDTIELADLEVEADEIDVVGSASIDGASSVGWVRRVMR
jgi:hypothetical protein